DLYLRLATHDGLQEAVTLRAWSPQAYAEMVQTDTLTFGLYYGALGTVLLYNLFLFLSTRERAFGLYSAYVTAFFVWSFAFRGYAFQYWWPDAPTFNNQMLPIAAALAYATFGVFTVSYLDTARNAPRWMHRLLWGSLIGNLLAVSPALYNYYALSFALSIPVGTTQIVTALAIGGVLAWRGHRPARYFSVAFLLLAVGVVLYYLRVLGLLPSNLITENFLQIGSALEVLLLAFGLADQMNTLKAEKLRAEQQALSAQAALNSELENLVQRRTRALESANQRLAEMAITDELTGAFNRRHFNSAFPAEMARHLRNRHPLAFCMLDIDQFKLYNDRYGHLAGDNVLQKVASVIDKHLQRAGDQFFRLGGEEFGMLLNVNEPVERALAFIERIRADIEGMGIPHELSGHQVITASFGLVWVTPESPLVRAEDVYAEADSLLYQAKHEGRNRVVVKSV
ncbi:MAG: diguanylate cyclase, partial [Burkholderiales bacterium]|nr:diguanylate cyclase [Burkholderiales bacterium]